MICFYLVAWIRQTMGDQLSRPAPSRAGKYERIFRRFSTFSMVGHDAYVANLLLAEQALARTGLHGGCIIECGTWRGGMAAGLMVVGGKKRCYYFFDSFKGLPAAGEEDGDEARRWQMNKLGPRYFDNCSATLEEFRKVISLAWNPQDNVHIHEGWFDLTFPNVTTPPISVLRLDVDWYRSTMMCLDKFWDSLLPGAVILIDDYYDWEGCRKAVHAFLARKHAREAICQSSLGGVSYILKQ
jgi:O-methyltransferase